MNAQIVVELTKVLDDYIKEEEEKCLEEEKALFKILLKKDLSKDDLLIKKKDMRIERIRWHLDYLKIPEIYHEEYIILTYKEFML